MTDLVSAKPLPVTVEVEPRAGGSTLVYSLLAPRAAGQSPRVMIALMLRITNHGTQTLTFDKLRFAFAGPPFVAQTVHRQEDVLGDNLVIPASTTRNFHFSRLVTITFTAPAPPGVSLQVTFEESTQAVTVFRHLAQHHNPVAQGSYRLPFRAADLAQPGFVGGSSGHKGSDQRFAHDMGAAQWDPAEDDWRGLKPGSTENTNENQVDWGLPIYSMADGEVVSFANDVPDNPNPPEKITGGGGNHFVIRHGTERVLYAHFQVGSLNPDLLKEGAEVAAGQFLAHMGNSGSSTGCHLHIHALDDETGFFRPLQFRGGWVVDRAAVDPADLSAPWVALEGRGLPFDKNAIWPSPYLPVVIDRLGSVEHQPTDRFRVAALESERLVVALRDGDSRLHVLAASVSADGSTLGILGDSGDQGGTAGLLELVNLGFGLVATAVTTAENRLRLIVWRLSDGGSTVERVGDSDNQAGVARAISLASLGTGHLVTSVRTEQGHEKVILWRVSADGEQVERLGDSGDGPTSDLMAAAPAGLGRFVTAVRADGNRLVVEVWDVSPDGESLTRRSDSGTQAGAIGDVRLASMGPEQVVTVVATESGTLKLIVWSVDDGGIVSRAGDSGGQAGIAKVISVTRTEPEVLVTAVVTQEGTLKLIAWHVSAEGVVTRLGDSGQQAGETSVVDVTALAPDRLVAGIRTVSGRLKLIAWSTESVAAKNMMLGATFARVDAAPSDRQTTHEDLDDFTVRDMATGST